MAYPWYWSKNRYLNPDKKVNPHFVYDNAKTVVDDILKEWKKEQGHRLVLVKAEMQSGKTSIMRHLCYMLNAEPQEGAKIGVLPDNVHIMCSIPDTMLVEQTRDRMQGVIQFPKHNVHHSGDPIWENDVYLKRLKRHSVIILDESHWGTDKNGRIKRIFTSFFCPLFYNEQNFAIMKKYDTRVVLVTATPANELFDDWKCILTLKNDEGYYGVKQMLELNRIQDQCDAEMNELFKNTLQTSHPATTILQMFKDKVKKLPKQGNGFIIIRENSHDEDAKTWVTLLKYAINKDKKDMASVEYNMETSEKFLDVYCKIVGKDCAENCCRFAEYDSTPDGDVSRVKKLTGFDAVVNFPPDRVVIIFIKKALLAGKSLDTKNILMVIDLPCAIATQAEDTVAQGLVGRCCGYGKKDDNVYIITNKKEVENYRDWFETEENHSSKPSGRSSKNSAFNAEDVEYEWDSDAGENIEIDDLADIDLQVFTDGMIGLREKLGFKKFSVMLEDSKLRFVLAENGIDLNIFIEGKEVKLEEMKEEVSSDEEKVVYSKPKKVIKNKKPKTVVTKYAEK